MASGHGGRRSGAGRPAGSGWRPKVAEMRGATIEKMAAIVGSERDPLSVIVDFILDERLDIQTRMSAASIALPFLYPKLSATQVDARHTVVNLDAAAVVERLTARLERIAPAAPVAVINNKPEETE